MYKVVTVAEMRAIEAASDKAAKNGHGVSYEDMMENAGRAAAKRALAMLDGKHETRVTLLIGPGNNGGDGLVAGRYIAQNSDFQVRFYLLKKRDDTDKNYRLARDMGLFFAYAEDDRDRRVLKNLINSSDLIIDALFGIGIRLPLRDNVAGILRTIKQELKQMQSIKREVVIPEAPEQPASSPLILAIDCPSGLDCDTGDIDANSLVANETITFIAAKPGLFNFPGAGYVGKISIAPIDVPETLPELSQINIVVADGEDVRAMLPSRPLESNKGTFGKAFILAGCSQYIGAAGLAALGAYRAGAGLVTVGTDSEVVKALAPHYVEVTWLPLPSEEGFTSDASYESLSEVLPNYKALLIGPGWGRAETTHHLLERMLDTPLPPTVIDADGINLLATIPNWWERLTSPCVLTPHPGEMGRLTGVNTKEVIQHRWELAREKAQEWGIVLVLKGAHTLIASPDGNLVVLPFKTDALATAGTGDVLAGIITGLIAQGAKPFEAAIAGAYLHGLSGVLAGCTHTNRSVIARDIIEHLGEALKKIEGR